MRHVSLVLCVLVLTAALAGCSTGPSETVMLGEEEVRVYVADSATERSRGLQGYDELDAGQGMLFVFDDVSVRIFTMKDVVFPIDVVFFAEEGTVSAIVPLDPGSSELVSSPSPAPYVLELRQGWAAEHDIGVGSALVVPEELER